MRRPAVAMLVLLAGAAAAQGTGARDDRIEDWIGRVDLPLPSGWRSLTGTCIASADDPCAVAVSALRDGQSQAHAVLATRALRALDGTRPGGNRPQSLVTDALDVPALGRDGNELLVGHCRRGATDDPRIVAVVDRRQDVEWYVRFARLWRVDDVGRLRPLAPAGVRCRNEGFGYDG